MKRHCRRQDLVEAYNDVNTPSMIMPANMFAGALSFDKDAHVVAVGCCKLLERQYADVLASLKRSELPSFLAQRRVAVENAIDAATSNSFPLEIRDLIVKFAGGPDV